MIIKNLLSLVISVLLGISVLSAYAVADMDKGERIILKNLSKPCGMHAGKLAEKHTQAGWKAIFDSGRFNEEILKICPENRNTSDLAVQVKQHLDS